MKYRAFISYSHAADGRLAPALQAALHRFAKKWHQLRAIRVFRDKSSLAVSPALWDSIRAALIESEFFLLMASPDATASKWVRREIGTWLEKEGNHDRLLIILTEGEMKWDSTGRDFDWDVTTALPKETLRGRFKKEPLFVDLTWARSESDLSLNNPDFKNEVASIAATLHSRPKDELVGDDVREHRKTIRLARSGVTALVLLTIVAGIAAFVAFQQRDTAQQFLGRVQTASGLRRAETGDTWGALIWFAEALKWDNDNARRERAYRVRLSSYLRSVPRLVQVLEHDFAVNTAIFSPDGTRVVTATGTPYRQKELPGSARVWDARTGQPITEKLRHDGTVYSASFSPDGRRVVTAGGDGTGMVWDAATGEALLTLPHKALVRRAIFSPDGARILTAADAARVWDATTGELLAQLGETDWNIWEADFSPDGDRVVAMTANPFMDGGNEALLWDLRTDKAVRLPMGGNWGYDGSFGPDGTQVVTASSSRSAQVWNTATSEPIGVPMEHEHRVSHASFSPDGKRVLTASWDGTARLWQAATGKPVTLRNSQSNEVIPFVLRHGGRIKYATFSPDGGRIATASTDGTVKVWDTRRGSALTAPLAFSHLRYPGGVGGFIGDESPGAEFHVRFSPDGQHLVTGGWDGTARIWNLSMMPRDVGPIRLATASRADRAFVPPLKFAAFLDTWPPRVVVMNTPDGTVQVSDPMTGKLIGTPPRLERPAGEVALSSDGRRLATISQVAGYVARVWDVATGKAIAPPLRHEHYVAFAGSRHVEFSSDGRRLATISNGHTEDARSVGFVHVWDLERGELAFPALEHDAWVKDVTFDRNGGRLVTARSYNRFGAGEGRGGEVRIWDTETGLPAAPTLRHASTVSRVWFTPDDTRIVTLEGFDKAVINVWDAQSGTLETRIRHSEGEVNTIALSTSAHYLATAGTKQKARVWELASGAPVTPWLEHTGSGRTSILQPTGLTSVAFSPDGRQLATGSADRTLRVWEVENGLPLTPFIRHEEPIQDLAFDASGARILVLGSDGLFSAWPLTPDERPIEDLVRITQILGVRKLDETGNLTDLQFSEFLDRWKEHTAAPGRLTTTSTDSSTSGPSSESR